MKKVILADALATQKFGQTLADRLPDKAIIFLNGPLGAGKTTLVGSILKASGHNGSTKSPTYTIVEPYQIGEKSFYHFDLYRLGDPEELEYIGIRDYLDQDSVCFFEWPEKGSGLLPKPDLTINLDYHDESRTLNLVASEQAWAQKLVDELAGESC